MKINQTLPLAFLLCVLLQGRAQVVSFDDLYFHSDFEKEIFQNLENRDTNYLALIMAASPKADEAGLRQASLEIQQLVDDLNPEKMARYSPKKKIKKIFKKIHADLLQQYEINNQFYSIFKNGNYNCVSSSMIYALVLDHFGIDYVITETPEHVYLISLFGDEQIILEGTDPQQGYIQLTPRLYQQQIEMLLAQKMITEKDLENQELLDRKLDSLFPSEYISMLQLVADQYYNQSVFDFNDGNFLSSYQNAKKAHYLAPRLTNDAMLVSVALEILAKEDRRDTLYPEMLSLVGKLDTTAEVRQSIIEDISLMAYNALLQDKDVDFAEQTLAKVHQRFADDSTLINATMADYHLYRADFEAMYGDQLLRYQHASQALKMRPEDELSAQSFIGGLAGCIMGYKIDRSNALDTLKLYDSQFPVLRKINNWTSVYGEVLLQQTHEQLAEAYTDEVKANLQTFEDLVEQNPNGIISGDLVAGTYSRLALKQFNRSRAVALKTIERGLKYAPGHPQLLQVQNMIR